MVDLDKIAAVYLSFPYITAEVEIAGFYASSPHSLNRTLEMRLEYVPNTKLIQKNMAFQLDYKDFIFI